MEVYLSERLWGCLGGFCFGIAAGLLYDVFRIFYLSIGVEHSLKELKHRSVFSFAICIPFDIIYSVITSAGFAVLTYALASGKPRLEILSLAIIGFLLYRVTLGRLITYCSKQIIFALRRVVYWILKCVLYPVRLLLRLVRFSVSALLGCTLKPLWSRFCLERSKRRIDRILKEKLPESIKF